MGSKYLIGITDYVLPPADIEQAGFPGAKFVFLGDWREFDENAKLWRQVDAILLWHWHLDKATVEVLDNCKIIVRYGVGYDLVDVGAVCDRGIAFSNTPDSGIEEVADTACAMILNVQRKILPYDRVCRGYSDRWQEDLLQPHQRTSAQTLGIIGVGRIGTAVVNRMKPFGFRIVGYDPYKSSGHEKAVGYERVNSLSELLEVSDIVTIHCPLTDETKGMIDEDFIGKMKDGASLVNTARGRIFASLDCIEEALRCGKLSSVATDVLPDEPPQDHSLLTAWRNGEEWLDGRLIINPHAAYYSEQGWYEMRYKAAETARLYLEDGKLRNQVLP